MNSIFSDNTLQKMLGISTEELTRIMFHSKWAYLISAEVNAVSQMQ
jgi:hypothetical protein